jgi:hypothetical protein
VLTNVGYAQILATDYLSRESTIQKKGQLIMGDKSPKSVHKQASQKQVKASAAAQKKQQATAAKQVTGKK